MNNKLLYVACSNLRPAPYQDEEVCAVSYNPALEEWVALDGSIFVPVKTIGVFRSIIESEMKSARVFRVGF